MLELLVFVAGSYLVIRFMYPRKIFKTKHSQTEMQSIQHQSTQTEYESDSMSIEFDNLDLEIDDLFFSNATREHDI